MGQFWIPGDSDFALAMREPNLLVPGKKPIGQTRRPQIPGTHLLLYHAFRDSMTRNEGHGIETPDSYSATLKPVAGNLMAEMATADASQAGYIRYDTYFDWYNYVGANGFNPGTFIFSVVGYDESPSDQQGIINWGADNGTSGFYCYIDTTGEICACYQNWTYAVRGPVIQVGKEYHCVVTVDVNKDCRLWVNGIYYGVDTNATLQVPISASLSLELGRLFGTNTYGDSLNGAMGFAALYYGQIPDSLAAEVSKNVYKLLWSANDSPFMRSVPAVGGATGTGDLVGAGSEIVGTGTRIVTGAGALEGQGAAVVGTGERVITGTGALIGQGSDVAGTGATGGMHTGVGDLIGAGSEVVGVGKRTITGTGVLVAQGSEVVGVGERTIIGSGDLVGAGAGVSGSGAVGGITTGTGGLIGAGSEIVGTGLRTVTGSGALVAQGSTVTGTGERVITGAGALIGSGSEIVGAGIGGDVTTGAGALVGQGSAVTGTGTRKITGVGELVAAGSIIVGAGVRTITGSGALVGAGSEVVGRQTSHDFATGNTNIWMLGPRGRVWSLENRDPYDAHKRGREVCSS